MSTNRNTSLLGRSNRYMESSSPSMVHRAGDSLVVRSVVSGTALNIPGFEEPDPTEGVDDDDEDDDEDEETATPENLPQCKIKRNYTCQHCNFFTQNPRTYLYHLKDEHKEKIRVYECPKCVYASKHSQKLQRHIHMVHVVGRQNQRLAKKMSPSKQQPSRAGRSKNEDEEGDGEVDGDDDSDEDTLVMGVDGPEAQDEEMDEMDDCEDEGGEEEDEEEEMVVDNSGHNSSTENDQEPSPSLEQFKCSICSYTSLSRTLVQRHENFTHLKKKFFRCSKCNYVTHMKARFTKHVKYHSMPMIKCDLCDFRTPYKWNLDRHYKNHQGDGEFKCPLCNFTADIKQSLTVHVQNHHLTPQQRLMRGMGRRNKVGASDAPAKELRMSDVGLVGAAGMTHSSPATLSVAEERGAANRSEGEEEEEDESCMDQDDNFQVSTFEVSQTGQAGPIASTSGVSSSSASRRQPKIKLTLKKMKGSTASQEQNERHHFDSDFIHPDDVLHKNGKIYYKNLKCSYCSFRAFWEGDILRHESKVHGVDDPRQAKIAKKQIARPIPNLIPLQQQTPPPSMSILRIPAARSRRSSSSGGSQAADISEQDINEICAKSSNSALKDFASLIGEAFPMDESQATGEETQQPTKLEDEKKPTDKTEESLEKKEGEAAPAGATTSKKKNATSFFDKLKETLIGQEVSNLVCEHCGHESKCLSEAICHQKIHKDEEKESAPSNQRSIVGMVGLSSTRCQHCRHRCKTSADLLVHLQSCLSRDSTSDGQGEDDTQDGDKKDQEEEKEEEEEEEPPQCPNCEQRFDTEEDLSKHLDYCKPRLELNPEVSITEVRPPELHPMENKVFVWNQFTTEPSPEEMKPTLTIERIPAGPQVRLEEITDDRNKTPDRMDEDDDDEEDPNLFGVETAPGYGAVTNQKGISVLKPSEDSHVQKVYKCPQCAFWASAASRFHIHLVGHLNRKPFGCSQCEYRSNWRWDVAKHIRLKGVRDPAHAAQSKPRVLVNDDDTSRRNYSKYSKFLTLMTVRLGQTQSDSPPPPPTTGPSTSQLPAPPRLIPAPSVPRHEAGGSRQQPLRPPPPLRAASLQVLSQLANLEDRKHGVKRPLLVEGTQQGGAGVSKPTEQVTKRLLWRCKKCNYRGLNKEQVLAHVRTHYQNLSTTSQASQSPKPDGQSTETMTCDKCPFVGRWIGELRAHQQHHVPQPGAIFKCYLCPFYVATKRELLTHMRIHGVNEPEDHLSQTMQAKLATKNKQDDDECESSPGGSKRYKCNSCPYETNAKGQYVYHMQLHNPSPSTSSETTTSNSAAVHDDGDGPPFRCKICSYTVAKRHLLHQHLRVHGIVVPPARISPSSNTSTTPNLPPLDTSKMKEVPLVWVMKNNKYLKMFKCRFCPHVNLRKVNILEHEKMHKMRKSSGSSQPVPSDPSGMVHRCAQCSYQCNNAGVLSAHAKVHQEWYPRSCSLVDLQRSDDAQLRELGGEMADSADVEDVEMDAGVPMEASYSGNGLSEAQSIDEQHEEVDDDEEEDTRLLYFCRQCPARFLFSRELAIHRRFHRIRLQHHCPSCSYTARQPSHLLAHAKVHTQEYQDRTDLLCQQHQMSQEHPKPLTIQEDNVWVIVKGATPPPPPPLRQVPPYIIAASTTKQYACDRCPARFFKSVALSYHLTLHGGPGPFKCKSCDYSVKMYGNLVRHEPVHAKEEQNQPTEEQKTARASLSVPMDFTSISGTDLYHHRESKMGNGTSEYPDMDIHPPQLTPSNQPLIVDPVFGTLMHGNPKFIYPTYLKNGKMKEKRYKCHKCPSAFEKREQYKVHLSLHGSRQKYRCDRCDYSVKYYANFIQHIRKHKANDEVRQAYESREENSDDDMPNLEEEMVNLPPVSVQRTAGKSIGQSSQSPTMSTVERQHLLIQQRRRAAAEDMLRDETISIVPSYWCPHCPYNSMRRDGVETHSKRHLCNNPSIKTTFLCQHCDYSAPQSHFLREHNKLHFRWKPQPPGRRPETFMKGDQVELWSCSVDKENGVENEQKLVFQDKGMEEKENEERFLPELVPEETSDEGEDDEDVYFDLRTGEIVSDEAERLKSVPTDGQNTDGSTEQPAETSAAAVESSESGSSPEPEAPSPSESLDSA